MKLLLALACSFPLFASAQTGDSLFIKKISNEIMVNGQAYNNLRHLTKSIGARLTASPNAYKAEAWGIETMKQSGADTAYLQPCMVPHWLRGGQDKTIITSIDGKRQKWPLDVAALGNSLGSGSKGVSGEVIVIKSYDELEARKGDVKGKVVFYNVPFDERNIAPMNSYGQTGKYRYVGASRAAKYGAVGVIVRSLTQSSDNNPHTGAMGYNDSFPKIPAVAVGLRDADSLYQKCQHQQRIVASIFTFGFFLPDTMAHNVIAELKGTEHPDQIITIGGHLDSWDLAEGAHDDGTGVVHTIEVLRALKALHYQPKHTIRFVLFANEENGLRGGKAYYEAAKDKKEQHIFALESDEGGFTPRGFSFSAAKEKTNKLEGWKDLLKPYGGDTFSDDGGGADIGALHDKMDVPVAGFIPDGQRYFDYHHARSDVFEAVNRRELLLGCVNIAALIYLVDKYGL